MAKTLTRDVDLAPIEEFSGDQQCLNGLADPDVVGDQQTHGVETEGHEQWHELIRPWLDGDPAERSERPGARAYRQPDCVAQQLT